MKAATEPGPNLGDLVVSPKTVGARGLSIRESVLLRAHEVGR
jgi:hypothetical protein